MEEYPCKVRVVADAAIDQGHADASAGVIRLPRDFSVHCSRCVIERRQLPVRADVYDVCLIRQVHNTGTVENSDHAVDERQLTHDFQNVAYEATDEAEQSTAIGLRSGLCSGRILHDHLHRLGGIISPQFGRDLGIIGIAECDRHQQAS